VIARRDLDGFAGSDARRARGIASRPLANVTLKHRTGRRL
jgi:hypothetical protein